ncbi:MAG: Slp family lipoprotein [Syntrophobacterales bacterium]|nr:Slp family lipoprotein [Syntrophobacterales bacterium]
MKRKLVSILLGFLLILTAYSCAPSMFGQYASQIKEPITLLQAKANPARYKGEMVIWGGKIVKVTNRQEGTYFEILQFPLGYDAKPKEGDNSEGRFAVVYPGFLDPAIYRESRLVTVAGRIQGVEVIAIGEVRHTVPLVKAEKIHLWEEARLVSPWYEACSDVVCFHTHYWWRWHYCCW